MKQGEKARQRTVLVGIGCVLVGLLLISTASMAATGGDWIELDGFDSVDFHRSSMTDRGAPATGCGSPSVRDQYPPPGAQGIPRNSLISATLVGSNCEIDPGSVTLTVANEPVEPEILVTEKDVRLVYQPSEPFEPFEEVLVELTGCVYSSEGMTGDGTTATGPDPCLTRSWSFGAGIDWDDSPPAIRIGGYGTRVIHSEEGGTVNLVALAQDDVLGSGLLRMELLVQGSPTGILLEDDGHHGDFTANDGVFGFSMELPPGSAPPGRYLLGIEATDHCGNRNSWPHLSIRDPSGFDAAPSGPPPTDPAHGREDRTSDSPDRPVVAYAGWDDTVLYGGSGGTIQLLAVVSDPDGLDDIASVELHHQDHPTGIQLLDDGTQGDFGAGDGVYGFRTTIQQGLPVMDLLFSIVAVDHQGNESVSWPYLVVE